MSDQIIKYGPCECRIWPLVPYQKIGRCKFCGTRPDEFLEDDYDAAVKRFVREKQRLPECFYVRTRPKPDKRRRFKKPITVAASAGRVYSVNTT